jgi:exonuclease III
VFCWCRKKKIDIACLQEAHCSIDTELKWKKEWGAKNMWNHGSSNSRGVTILFLKKN